MPIINLFTDYRNDPLYTGAILSQLRQSFDGKIVETTHFLPYDNLLTSSFIIKNLYSKLPKGTIHLICTNTSNVRISQYLAMEYDEHYFLLADNGLVDLITDQNPKKLYSLPFKDISSFAELDILLPNAIKLAHGEKIENLGPQVFEYKKMIPRNPVFLGNKIEGTVIYIDSYGNAITNISRQFFEKYRKGRNYKIWLRLPMNILHKINETYKASPGEFNAIFNSFGLLELSVIYGNVAQMLQVKENETEVVVEFYK